MNHYIRLAFILIISNATTQVVASANGLLGERGGHFGYYTEQEAGDEVTFSSEQMVNDNNWIYNDEEDRTGNGGVGEGGLIGGIPGLPDPSTNGDGADGDGDGPVVEVEDPPMDFSVWRSIVGRSRFRCSVTGARGGAGGGCGRMLRGSIGSKE